MRQFIEEAKKEFITHDAELEVKSTREAEQKKTAQQEGTKAPVRPLVDEVTVKALDPCAWGYVLNQDDLASFRLKARSDVVGTWEIASTTYNHFYCQVKIVVSGCGFKLFVGPGRPISVSKMMNLFGSFCCHQISIS